MISEKTFVFNQLSGIVSISDKTANQCYLWDNKTTFSFEVDSI